MLKTNGWLNGVGAGLALYCAACGGVSEAPGTGQPPGTGVPPQAPGVVAGDDGRGDVPAGATCRETITFPDYEIRNNYVRRTWDADQRTATEVSSTTADFEMVQTLKWRYRSDGQILAYVGVDNLLFQHDYAYDEHDNVVDFYLSYPETPDLMQPSSAAPWIGTSYANEYDAAGRLVQSSRAPYGEGAASIPGEVSTFTEDTAGRCIAIASELLQEQLSYDDAGRLSSITRSMPTSQRCPSSTTTLSYDAAGRLLGRTLVCSGGFDGTTTSSEDHTYEADGSETVDRYDGQTDVLGDAHWITTRSAECLAIDAAIGALPDARCRAR
jgi:YD repeat-containing protein